MIGIEHLQPTRWSLNAGEQFIFFPLFLESNSYERRRSPSSERLEIRDDQLGEASEVDQSVLAIAHRIYLLN